MSGEVSTEVVFDEKILIGRNIHVRLYLVFPCLLLFYTFTTHWK